MLLSFVSTTFLGFFEARAEIQKYFCSFFGSNENFKMYFRDLLTFSSHLPHPLMAKSRFGAQGPEMWLQPKRSLS